MKDSAAVDRSNGKVTAAASPPKAGPSSDVIESDEADVRARPGRRTVEERQKAVLDLLAGKATADQVARRLGVLPSTVEGWRDDALAGIGESLRRGTGRTARELELERDLRVVREALTEQSITAALYKQALDVERKGRPTAPARSRR
jgi:transposase-like protein